LMRTECDMQKYIEMSNLLILTKAAAIAPSPHIIHTYRGGGAVTMKRKFNQQTFQSWIRTAKDIGKQFIIPFVVFQAVRTILLPTSFDVLLLAIFILLSLAFYFDWI
jgi:hypothetical protein